MIYIKKENTDNNILTYTNTVPIWEKYALTINEATQYFNLGEKKIRGIVSEYMDYGFVIQNGTKSLIKRKKFEEFMNELTSI